MKTIKTETIVRTALLILALANQLLSAVGHPVLPIEDSDVEALITTGATIVTALWSWWKNNSFTQAAITADEHLADLKVNARENQ